MITRFELPFDIYCQSCEAKVSHGNRYNAEKKKVGSYYTTPIWRFGLKCHLCGGRFEMETDPKNTQYVIVSGARRTAADQRNEQDGAILVKDLHGMDSDEEENAFEKIEKKKVQVQSMNEKNKELKEIYELNSKQWDDDHERSQALRKSFRVCIRLIWAPITKC